MKLLLGAISYLAVVAAVVVAAFSGIASIERKEPKESSPMIAKSAGDYTSRRAFSPDDTKIDPNRVPVWIAPTVKYEYTPVPVDQHPKHSPVIGHDARASMAKAGHSKSRHDGRRAIENALGNNSRAGGSSLGFAPSRDNDPFFRD